MNKISPEELQKSIKEHRLPRFTPKDLKNTYKVPLVQRGGKLTPEEAAYFNSLPSARYKE